MKNFVQNGEIVTVTAPAAVESGEMVVIGSLLGVAQGAVASGADVEIVRRGVFTLPKTSAQAWTVGDKIYWNSGNAECTTTASGNKLIGVAQAAAANPSPEGNVLLDGAAR